MGTFLVLVGALGLLLLWLLLGSRLRWRTRLLGFAAVVALLLLSGTTLRIRGVSGDVIPILEWRWASDRPVFAEAAARGAADEGSAPAVGAGPFDYPQFLGPRRNGTVDAVRLDPDWSDRPPRPLWRRSVGEGWSAFAVQGDLAVTQEQWGPRECVTARRLDDGELVWSHCDLARFENPIGGPGPRATPTLSGDRVYTLGGTGILNALELGTGRLIWSRRVVEENGSRPPVYGVSASPLLFDDLVVVIAGGSGGRSLVAYDRRSGEPRWSGGNDPAAYSSPFLVDLAGRRQVVAFNQRNLVGHDADGGAVLWSFPWAGQSTERVSQPVPLTGDRLFVSSGYGVGGKLLRIEQGGADGMTARMIWESRGLKAKFTNVVHRDGHLFGLDDGVLVCLRVEDGERKWKRGRYGHGQLILIHDLLLIQAENGDVALVEASPEGHRELARLPVLGRKTWNHPALAGRHLLVRNDREAACLELPLLGRG
jgi:outer membrane protein assembly factor BamB